ncbi:MAG: PilZ domain-containing protein [Planctomycetota bacterium]|jgi:hypothetical protein
MPAQPPDVESEESQLVSAGRAEGTPDDDLGRRRCVRWTASILLEVSRDPADPAASWPATMHSIAQGGTGFWSRRTLREGDTVCIREWGQSQPWLSARVVHCTQYEGGFLVGVEFDTQASAE